MTQPTHNDIQRDIGRMEGRLDAMEDRLSKIETITERIDTRLARMEATESERSGAFKFGHWLAGIGGAAVLWLADHFMK